MGMTWSRGMGKQSSYERERLKGLIAERHQLEDVPYSLLRPEIRTGDLFAFSAMRFRDIRSLPEVGGWLSNRIIRTSQWRGNVDGDGLEDFIHVGVSLVDKEHDEVYLLEYISGMCGLKPIRLSKRIATYPGIVAYFPLTPSAVKWSQPDNAVAFLREHRKDKYSVGGLLYPELRFTRLKGRLRLGRQFCSEGVVHFEQAINTWPKEQKVWRRGFYVDAVRPWQYSPVEVIRACCFDRKSALVVTNG
jgi:hypothetical protein